MARQLRHRLGQSSSDRGFALLEMALVLPVLVVLVFGTIDVVDALSARMSVVDASREGARVASRLGVYSDDDVRAMVEGRLCANLMTCEPYSIILTRVTIEGSSVTASRTVLNGDGNGCLPEGQLGPTSAMGESEQLVAVEVVHKHSTITGFLRVLDESLEQNPMCSYTVMKVSGSP